MELSLGPRFPARPVCEQAKLAQVLQNCRINWRQNSFPYSSSKFVSQHESVFLLTPSDTSNRVGFVEANIWGMLYYGSELDIEIGPKQTSGIHQTSTTGIHLYRLVGHLLVFIKHAKQMISGFGYEGPLSIDITLSGILDIPWLYSQDKMGIYKGPVSELDDAFSFCLPTTSDALRERRDALAMNMLQYILFGMNWSDYASNPELLEELVRSGYEYNLWGKPAALEL